MRTVLDAGELIKEFLIEKYGEGTEEYKREFDKYFTVIECSEGTFVSEMPSDYTVIDIETTGLEPRYDEIIEISCIKYRNDAEIEKYHSLVKPECRWSDGSILTDFISNLTGITDDMLYNAPSFKDIADDIHNFIKNEVLVGHNIKFDISFLRESFLSNDKIYDCENNTVIDMSNDYVDTLRLSRKLFPALNSHKLIDLALYFDLVQPTHRSMDDCITTHQLFMYLKKYIKEHDIEYASLLNRKRTDYKQVNLRDLVSENVEIDENSPFYEKNVVFTGVLEKLPRVSAAQIVVNMGGHCQNGVNKKTDILVVGGFDMPCIKDGKSGKLKKVEQINLNGGQIQIINEFVFYTLIQDWLK